MLTEKTLELNLTFEMLTLGDTLWNLIQFAACAPRVIAGCTCYRPAKLPNQLRPPYAVGMTLQDELRNGWDVKIQFQPTIGRPAHALFLQYKAGSHKKFSTMKSSAFHGSKTNISPFCEFWINNNSNNDQHLVLRTLASQPAIKGAVAYVFPRVSSAKLFKACLGRLIHVTTIIKIDELDTAASRSGVNLSNGHHRFRTSYTAPLRTEVCSDPKELIGLQSRTGDVFADLIACRLYQTLSEWQEILRDHWTREDLTQVDWRQIFITYEAEIARYLAIHPIDFQQITMRRASEVDREINDALNAGMQSFDDFGSDFDNLLDTEESDSGGQSDFGTQGRIIEDRESLFSYRERLSIYAKVAESIRNYREIMNSAEQWVYRDIPLPRISTVSRINPEGADLNLSEIFNHVDERTVTRMLSDINFQIF